MEWLISVFQVPLLLFCIPIIISLFPLFFPFFFSYSTKSSMKWPKIKPLPLLK